MRDEDVFRKTEAGRDEIEHRHRRLAPQLRTILLMVDGRRSVRDLRAVIAGVHAPADTLVQLQAMELIETTPSGFDPASLLQAVSPGQQPGDAVVAAPAALATPTSAPEPAVSVVQPLAVGDYHRLYEGMSEAIRAHLGLRGYFMQLKVERCQDAVALRALLPEMRQALAKAKGEGFADTWLLATAGP